jgi:tRNA threonylcarbamoyladenosine biosynthesis protein TsaE
VDETLTIPLPSRRATRRLGGAIASAAAAGDRIFLEGDLGAGKTFLVRGIARGLGIAESIPIQSPTFALVHEHPLPRGPARLIHVDLYRLGDGADLSDLGLEETDDAVTCIEWGARFGELAPPSGSLSIVLMRSPRIAHLTGRGARGAALVRAVRHTLARPDSAG